MPDGANDNEALPAPDAAIGVCPLCGKPRVLEYRPFCSKRCADIDLARWLGGRYALPAAPPGAEMDEDEPGES